jgi:membrane-associated phospholipid phosphatase
MRAGLAGAFVRLALAASVVLASAPARAGSGEEPAPSQASTTAPSVPLEAARSDGRRTIGRLPANLGRAAVGVLHADNLVPFVAGGTAAATASFFDDDVRESAQTLDWGESLETGAGPIWSSVFVAGMFTAGRLAPRGSRLRAMTYDMLDAAVVNFAWTEGVKLAVGRQRPNGQDEKSFPSGHASNSFALAAVAERHYGWKAGVPAYLVAGLVGASRIEQDKHYLSDVVAGAALGYIVGRTVVRVNSRPIGDARGASIQLSPLLGHGRRGLQISLMHR